MSEGLRPSERIVHHVTSSTGDWFDMKNYSTFLAIGLNAAGEPGSALMTWVVSASENPDGNPPVILPPAIRLGNTVEITHHELSSWRNLEGNENLNLRYVNASASGGGINTVHNIRSDAREAKPGLVLDPEV